MTILPELIERLADEATREIHGDDYRLSTRLIIERVIRDFIISATAVEPAEPFRWKQATPDRVITYVNALRSHLAALRFELAELLHLNSVQAENVRKERTRAEVAEGKLAALMSERI